MAKVKDSQNKSEWHGFKSQTWHFYFILHFVNLPIAKSPMLPVLFQRTNFFFFFFTSKIWLKTLEFTLKFHFVAFTQNLSMYIAHDIGI